MHCAVSPLLSAYFFAAFFTAAQRALAAAAILALPSGESFRFFFTDFAATSFMAPAAPEAFVGRPLFFAAGVAAPASSARAC
jgi:hypothetical protein